MRLSLYGVAPIDDNAYTCGCRCDAAPVTKTVTIVANTDDAEQDGANVRLGGNELHIGPDIVGLRFVNVGLPKDATIVSATVQFTSSAADVGPDQRGDRRRRATPTRDVHQHRQRHQRPASHAGLGAVVAGPVGQQRDGTGRADARPVRAARGAREPGRLVGDESRGAALRGGHRPASSGLVLGRSDARRRAPGDVHRSPQRRRARLRDAGHRGAERGRRAPAGGGRRRLPRPRDRQPEGAGRRLRLSDGVLHLQPGDPGPGRRHLRPRRVQGRDLQRGSRGRHVLQLRPQRLLGLPQERRHEASCEHFIAANSAGGGAPVCLATERTPGMAARLFGNHSTCDVSGSSHIQVGDREPKHDPHTTGTVDILGDPCPGGSCPVGASIGLAMAPITFSVHFASDPTFFDLSASGDTALTTLDGVDAVFAQDTVRGTGNGRRGHDGLAVNALNAAAAHAGHRLGEQRVRPERQPRLHRGRRDPRRHLRRGPQHGLHGGLARLRRRGRSLRSPGSRRRADDRRRRPRRLAPEPAAHRDGGRGPDRRVHVDRRRVVHAQRERDRPRPERHARELASGSRTGPEVGQTLVSQQSLGVGAQQTTSCASSTRSPRPTRT